MPARPSENISQVEASGTAPMMATEPKALALPVPGLRKAAVTSLDKVRSSTLVLPATGV